MSKQPEVEGDHPTPNLRTVEMEGFKLDPNYYLGADYDKIDSVSLFYSPVLGWLNERIADFAEYKHNAAQEIKRAEARAYMRLKGEGGWEASGYPGKPTEKALEYAVTLDEAVQEAQAQLGSFIRWHVYLNDLLRTFMVKLDLMRSTESSRRKTEWNSVPE